MDICLLHEILMSCMPIHHICRHIHQWEMSINVCDLTTFTISLTTFRHRVNGWLPVTDRAGYWLTVYILQFCCVYCMPFYISLINKYILHCCGTYCIKGSFLFFTCFCQMSIFQHHISMNNNTRKESCKDS